MTIFEFLKQTGMSKRKFAMIARIHYNHFCMVLRGERNMSRKIAALIQNVTYGLVKYEELMIYDFTKNRDSHDRKCKSQSHLDQE